jgi:hypothetical protein
MTMRITPAIKVATHNRRPVLLDDAVDDHHEGAGRSRSAPASRPVRK